MRRSNIFIVSLLLLFLSIGNVVAFDDVDTHPAITRVAMSPQLSNIDGYIKDYLGYADGIVLKLQGVAQVDFKDENGKIVKKGNLGTQSVLDWLRQGSTAEDIPNCRAASHFHNPLKSWNVSGGNDLTVQNWFCEPVYSAVTWATGFQSKTQEQSGIPINFNDSVFTTEPERAPNNWNNARHDYYWALTSSSTSSREYYLSKSLGALGQVVHLLEDMAVPAHTRNDFWSHLYPQLALAWPWEISKFVYQPFERYVKKNYDALVSNAAQIASINAPTFSNPMLTDFWDTRDSDDTSNPQPPSTATNIGLAEFSNANYFSNLTIPNNNPADDHKFPNPSITNSTHQICEETRNVLGLKRRYVSRKSITGPDCNQIDHFAAVPYLVSFSRSNANMNNNISTIGLMLDDKVHETYAKELLPRAIGYSSKLIDYFFRGTLKVAPPAERVYAITDGSVEPQKFSRIKAKVTNTTLNEDMKDGTLVVVAEYSIIPNYQPDLSTYPPTAAVMDPVPYSYSVSAPTTLGTPLAANTARDFVFNFPDQPIPAGITDLSIYVVFKGTLGNEKDNAIAVAWQPLFEPVHQTFWNLTDRFSIYDPAAQKHVLHTEGEINNNPALREQVDWNNNNITSEWPNEPYIKPYPMSFEVGYAAQNPPAQPVTPVAAINNVTPGGYIRLVTLVSELENYVKLKSTNATVGVTEFIDRFYGTACGYYGSGFACEPKTTFRNVKQDHKIGFLRCYPGVTDAAGRTICPYDDPGNTITNFGPLPVAVTFGN